MIPARQPEPQPNPDMNYSALERLDIKFTELIGAIEEKQVDGQLSSKDHGDYELVCYCRGFIRAELEKERRATHTPAAPAERLCDECNIIELEERLIDLEQDLKDAKTPTPKYNDMIGQAAEQARKDERERVLKLFKKLPKQKHSRAGWFVYEWRINELIESLRGGA